MLQYLMMTGTFVCVVLGIYLGVITEISYSNHSNKLVITGRIFKSLLLGIVGGAIFGGIGGAVLHAATQIMM